MKILMRASVSPFTNPTAFQMLTRNMLGTNLGNLIFPYSVMRTLMTKGTKIDTISTVMKIERKEIKKINQTYDFFVLPLANAFRRTFLKELKQLTSLIKGLKIPVAVVGVGTQNEFNDENRDPELDAAVTAFMKAALKKSSIVGVRGEITAKYLKLLGFKEERDFTVIGCPSMYMWGKQLPVADIKELTPDSAISMNSKIELPQKFHDFMYKTSQQIEDHVYVPQVVEEIYRMYIGLPYRKTFTKKRPKYFPEKPNHEVYMKDKGLAFLNAKTWMDFLSTRDFSIGSRIHGNITAILSGTPCYILVSDSRIKELVDIHNIPHTMIKDLKKEDDIFKLHEKADFGAIHRGHEDRFMHYLDFLRANKLDTIYDENGEQKEEECLFDKRIAEIEFNQPEHPLVTLSFDEQMERMEPFMYLYQKLNAANNQILKNRMSLCSGKVINFSDWANQ